MVGSHREFTAGQWLLVVVLLSVDVLMSFLVLLPPVWFSPLLFPIASVAGRVLAFPCALYSSRTRVQTLASGDGLLHQLVAATNG